MVIHFEAAFENGALKLPKDVVDKLENGKKWRVTLESEEDLSADEAAAIIEDLIDNPPDLDGPFLKRDEIYNRKL